MREVNEVEGQTNPWNPQIARDAHPMVLSYLWIRRAVGALGLALPIMLGPIGWLIFGIDIQENMSSYYHTPLRDVFVGVLCAIGLFLFCYIGSSNFENWTGNLGCAAAIGVAWFPLDPGSDPLRQASLVGYLHSLAGGLFFVTLAIFSVYHFPRNEPEDGCPDWLTMRNTAFRFSGAVILLSVLAMGTYLILPRDGLRATLTQYNFLFWAEWVAVWAFAIAWLIKGRALAIIPEGIEALKSLQQQVTR